MTAPQRPASNSDARKRAEEKAAENDAPVTEGGWRTIGTHEADCQKFPTGWLCTATCEARVIPPGSAAS